MLKQPQDPLSVESRINLFSVRFKKKILFDLQISSRKIKVIDFLKANLRNQIGSVGFADTRDFEHSCHSSQVQLISLSERLSLHLLIICSLSLTMGTLSIATLSGIEFVSVSVLLRVRALARTYM